MPTLILGVIKVSYCNSTLYQRQQDDIIVKSIKKTPEQFIPPIPFNK